MRASLCLFSTAVRHSHVYLPVSQMERAFLATGSAILALADPRRADMVAMLGETTGTRALASLRDGMRADVSGAWLLEHRPRIIGPHFSPAALAATHAPATLGGAYAKFMASHDFSADARVPVRLVQDAELAYVLTRYREVHDFWHVLSGLPPTVLGEVALKWFEAAVTKLPSAALAAAGGPLRLTREEAVLLRSTLIPWALTAASRVKGSLLSVRYELLLDEPLDKVQEMIHFLPAPHIHTTT
jgi:ubiquinone biosynthesis protein COQ4